MKKLTPRPQGTIMFGESVRVSDPSYDHTARCVVDVPIVPGEYTFVSFRARDYFTINKQRYSETRTFAIGMYLDGKMPLPSEWDNPEVAGYIGVDAGMAGFYQGKPDLEGDDWFAFCDKLNAKHSRLDPYGFTSESGYGDGVYPVWVYRNADGKIVGVEVHF